MPSKPETFTFGVTTDTHIPDRVKHLPETILRTLEHNQIDQILHAGDAVNWKVFRQLDQIAPITIVQGNRDGFLGMPFPRSFTFTAHSLKITLTHGHRSMLNYLIDKWFYIRKGYQRYYQHLANVFPNADVIIIGHTHHQLAKWIRRQLFSNPGAAYPCEYNQYRPEFGILSITPERCIRTEHHKDTLSSGSQFNHRSQLFAIPVIISRESHRIFPIQCVWIIIHEAFRE